MQRISRKTKESRCPKRGQRYCLRGLWSEAADVWAQYAEKNCPFQIKARASPSQVTFGVAFHSVLCYSAGAELICATQRSQDAPSWLRAAACAGWIARWTGMVAVATQRALASSLLELPPHGDTIDGDIPSLPDLLAGTRFDVPASPSRPPPAAWNGLAGPRDEHPAT